MNDPLKVVFIAGWGRSGTTLLDMLLGQCAGFFSAGEIRYIWDRGLLENRPCGCSVPFRSCPIWSRAAAQWTLAPRSELEKIVRLRDAFRTRQCWHDLTRRGQAHLQKMLEDYSPHLESLYAAIAQVTGSQIIVDSSKIPSHGYVLGLLENVEAYVVHLVRDPRAVAFSWQRKKVYDVPEVGPMYIPLHSTVRSSMYWLTWNTTTELLWGRPNSRTRYCRVSYENLIRDPHEAIRQIQDLVNEPTDLSFLQSNGTAELVRTHMIAGNPTRFHRGRIRLELDEEWRTAMRRGAKLLSSLMTLPLMLRYGYLPTRRGKSVSSK